MKNNAPTMKDVAAEAGVALGTVSKVFNGIPVGEPYKRKVEEAALKLGYRVNHYARGMRTNRTGTIAVIIPVLDHPYFAHLTEELILNLAAKGYRALIGVTKRDLTIEARCIQMVREQKADGIIALTYKPDLEEIGDIPFVSIDRAFEGVPCITSDNFAGGRMAAARLIELGAKKLLFLRTGSNVPGETDKRGYGFEYYARTAGIPCLSIRENTEVYATAIKPHLDRMIEQGSFDYDGIFCSTDKLAYEVCAHLRQRNYRIPEDIQIIGFDGLYDFFSEERMVTTIIQNVEEIARATVEVLFDISNGRRPSLVCLPVTYGKGPTTRD